MSGTRAGRRGILGRGRTVIADDDYVEIAEDHNRWWNDRAFLEGTIKASAPAEQCPEPARDAQRDTSAFHTYFSTASLFEHDREPNAAARASTTGTDAGASTTSNLFGTPAGIRPEDPFVVLGVRAGASLAEITVRHRQLAKQYHPDLHEVATRVEAEQQMVKINSAYSELRRILRNVERLRVSAT